MALPGSLTGAAAGAALVKAKFDAEKKGKTREQKSILDFFATDYIVDGAGCSSLFKGKIGNKISMQEYMAMVSARCNSFNIQQRAMEKIGLDPSQIQEIPPICLSSFVYNSSSGLDRDKSSGIDNLLFKSENGEVVSSQYSVTWLFFTRDQICTYNYTFDMTSDDYSEVTRDFFYRDITAFVTDTELHERIINTTGCLESVKGCFKSESYEKENYTYDYMLLTVPEYKWIASMRNSPEMRERIMGVKAMLREKKYSMK